MRRNYTHRLVVDEEKNQGWLWLREPEEFWSFMKPTHKLVLERFGIDRGIVHLPVLATPIGGIPASPSPYTPGVASYGHSLPTPPVANEAGGVTEAIAGFQLKRPKDLPLSGQAVARAVARAEAVKNVPLSYL